MRAASLGISAVLIYTYTLLFIQKDGSLNVQRYACVNISEINLCCFYFFLKVFYMQKKRTKMHYCDYVIIHLVRPPFSSQALSFMCSCSRQKSEETT